MNETETAFNKTLVCEGNERMRLDQTRPIGPIYSLIGYKEIMQSFVKMKEKLTAMVCCQF